MSSNSSHRGASSSGISRRDIIPCTVCRSRTAGRHPPRSLTVSQWHYWDSVDKIVYFKHHSFPGQLYAKWNSTNTLEHT